MTRPSLLVSALAIAALLAAPAAALAATAPGSERASIEFDLAADNDFDLHVESFAGEITLDITNEDSVVSYEVEGESTEAGLKAQFGRLGLIDVAFEPTKTLDKSKPPKECKGEPWTEREGFFIGTIQFTGEREYVRVEATRARGTMSVTPEWRCPRSSGPIRPPDVRPPPPSSRAKPKSKADVATLTAFSRGCRCGFASYAIRGRKGRGPSIFFGAKNEKREAMDITRVTYAEGGPSSFVFDHAAGTAKLDPPRPFTGTATFKRRKGRDLWRSTLRVPLLGADPISLRGRGFRARMIRDLPGD